VSTAVSPVARPQVVFNQMGKYAEQGSRLYVLKTNVPGVSYTLHARTLDEALRTFRAVVGLGTRLTEIKEC
jgi:hypothetical protein